MKYIDVGLDDLQLATLDAWIAKREARVVYPEWRTDKELSAYATLMYLRVKKQKPQPSWQREPLASISQEQLAALYNNAAQNNPLDSSLQSLGRGFPYW